jgi:hypothetical protein
LQEADLMKRALVMALAGVLILACGEQPAAAPENPGSYRLFLRDNGGLTVADAGSGQVVNTISSSVPTPDWRHAYAVSNGVTLRKFDSTTGKKLAEMELPAAYQFPSISPALAAVSPNGDWVALSRWDNGGKASHFAVVAGTLTSPAKQIDLNGYWLVDALSNDGRWLYLIENLNPPRYRVRLYDLVTGALNPKPVIDPRDGDKPMSGDRVDSVASPDGSWVYSLYSTGSGGFIHALPVGSGTASAVCVDLPEIGSRDMMTMTMSADGSRLYVTDGLAERVVEVVPPGAGGNGKPGRSLRVPLLRVASNPFVVDAEAAGPGYGPFAGMHSVLTRSGILYFPTVSGMDAVDVKNWAPRGRYSSGRLRTIALSSDEKWLYATTENNSLLRIEPASGRRVQELRSGPWNMQLERALQTPTT